MPQEHMDSSQNKQTTPSSSSNMSDPPASSEPNYVPLQNKHAVSSKRPVVIGIYGLPGSGKSFLLHKLKQQSEMERFSFYKGSEVIDRLVSNGLEEFKQLEEPEKMKWRGVAIEWIKIECVEDDQSGLVAGHFMFWPEHEKEGVRVWTANDSKVYTHIIYLDVPAEVVQRRLDDSERDRPAASVAHIRKWQLAEMNQLRRLCRDHGILFTRVVPHPIRLDGILAILRDFGHHTEERNSEVAKARFINAFADADGQLRTILVLDADKTLAAEDTGTLFWKNVSHLQLSENRQCPLKALFSSPMGYSYAAFRQAMLLYEEAGDDQEFEAVCEKVASAVRMHPEFISLLQLVAEYKHVGAVVITSGIHRVWEKVLEREGLAKSVPVIGGGRLADGFVVTAEVKASLVDHLRYRRGLRVWAFGDSPLDLGMLFNADHAVVVVGEEHTRSKTMDAALLQTMERWISFPRQVLLPPTAKPRLTTTDIPLIKLTGQEIVDSIFGRHEQRRSKRVKIFHATKKSAAKLLMTPTRDASVSGPALREAYRRIGWYLATEFLSDMLGLETYAIPHVQGHHTTGHRLFHEQQTLIMPLMRGGEPMAFGVADAFPLSTFVHAHEPEDLKPRHVLGKLAVVLVDSVVNDGETAARFVRRVRELHATVRVVVVAGVVQERAVREGKLAEVLAGCVGVSVVALRLSDNKYTGKGTTDTGNRLFNTTDLD